MEDFKGSQENALTVLSNATRMLAEVRSVSDAKQIMDMAAAAKVYARKHQLGQEAVLYAQEIERCAKVKLGEILDEMELEVGRPKEKIVTEGNNYLQKQTLPEMGINRKLSMESQRLAKLAPEKKEAYTSGKITQAAAITTIKRQEVIQQAKEVPPPVGKYNIIYADPPWEYWAGGNKNASLHYSTMPITEICDLPVKDLSDDNCILFLWVTYPILPDCFKVMESWGFKYSTCGFVWIKRNRNSDTPFFGLGNWTRANTELCLIGIKGSMTRMDASISQIIETPIEEHSRKPDIVREKIIQLVGELPRIELFSRKAVEGWAAWGNEA